MSLEVKIFFLSQNGGILAFFYQIALRDDISVEVWNLKPSKYNNILL
uniref:Uncharacterized protein n=1 Tax=Kalanchoe fedtschenkoi TaxID=63787 RepID=A0A7N0VH62_KALFE